MAANNIVADFFAMARSQNSGLCMMYKREGVWKELSWFEVADLVHQYARGLIALGVKEGTPVAIFSATRMEWTIIDMAILAAGGITVPIYSNLPPEHVSFIVKDSAANIMVVENDQMLSKLRAACEGGKCPGTIIQIDGGGDYEGTMTHTALLEKGNECPEKTLDERVAGIDMQRPATFVYTSGTTGVQKGVVLTHGNIYAQIQGVLKAFDFNQYEICLQCLPFAHVLGRMTQFYVLLKGCKSAYAESLDKIADNYREVRPHFVVGVPRMLEKMYERVEAAMAERPWHTRRIYAWSKKVAVEAAELRQRKQPFNAMVKARYALAQKLVFNKLLSRLGGRMIRFVCGGAPLNKNIAKFFTGIGVQVLEGYGLTETFAAMTANRLDDFHFGTVGKPIEGVKVKLASDGEVLVGGPTVFQGYLHRSDATKEAFEDGWFKTGDIGEFSKEGFLRITDRKKDIIITSGGKNIAPQRIEGILTESPYISNVMVCGERRKYLTALVTLNIDAIRRFAEEEGIMFSSTEELLDHPEIKQLVDKVVAEKNRKLASFETIKRFAILPAEFTVESGEITPTLKVRRKIVTEKYKTIIDDLYKD